MAPPQGNPQEVALDLHLTAPYLTAFLACDTTISSCATPLTIIYLAQSDDGAHWQVVPGWRPFQGSVPDLIRRGQTLHIYTPGMLTRYHLDTGVLEATRPVPIEGVSGGFVALSLILDDQGRLVLFFLHGQMGGDPAVCAPEESRCQRQIGVATEVPGSDGSRFTLDADAGLTVEVGGATACRSVSDPDIFFDGRQYVLYLSHGLSISVWTSPDLRGTYTLVDALPGGLLASASGGVPAGYFDPVSGQYWTYAHYASGPNIPTVIRLTRPLAHASFTTILTGEQAGLGAGWMVGSPSFALN